MTPARTFEVTQGDLYELLVGAVRYALGRESYIVASTASLIRLYARELHPQQRNTILADLRSHVEDVRRGRKRETAYVTEVWERVLDEMEAARA